jgi:methylase of polypeptide subunit release factors
MCARFKNCLVYDARMLDEWLRFSDPRDYQRFNETLRAANYTVPGVVQRMGTPAGEVPATRTAQVLELTEGCRTPLDTLMRLFLGKAPVSEDALRDAVAPMSLDLWERIGLIRTEHGVASAQLKIYPIDHFYVTSDMYTPGVKYPADFVVGVGGATLTMANFMIRRQSRLTLDLGTGCGLLAILKSTESERVIATDQNPRAVRMTEFSVRINDLPNIECRQGDLFEPVDGLKFDFIVSNAPFVISPSSGYLYLDGGMKGDEFCQRLVRNAAAFLNEKGYCQMLCNWAHLKGQDWKERLAGWFKGTGCNVWVLSGPTQEPADYAKNWIQHIESADSPDYRRVFVEWMQFYEREQIEAMTFGLVTMQRSAGANWFRVDPQPQAQTRGLGEDITRIFELKDFLSSLENDEALLNCALRARPELRLDVRYEPSADGWRAVLHNIRIDSGLSFNAEVDPLAADFIGRCDGRRPVAAVLAEVAAAHHLEIGKITSGSLFVIRHLIERGFLVPA